MRADAQRNYDHLIAVARDVIAEGGAGASLREIARRAKVGLGTLHRHFPTREALLDALLRASLDRLTRRAADLERSGDAGAGLVSWFREGVAFVRAHRGIVDLMAAAIADPTSALHASCTAVRSAGATLLLRAQEEGVARADIDGTDLFALMGALGWIGDQPGLTDRVDHLTDLIADTLLTMRPPGARPRRPSP